MIVKLVPHARQEQKFLSIASRPDQLRLRQAPAQWLQGAKHPGPEPATNHLPKGYNLRQSTQQ
jgi:hypothetical protein